MVLFTKLMLGISMKTENKTSSLAQDSLSMESAIWAGSNSCAAMAMGPFELLRRYPSTIWPRHSPPLISMRTGIGILLLHRPYEQQLRNPPFMSDWVAVMALF